ncbi:unnamed protein product, partial [Ascophyllum nodosum]
GTGQQLPPLTKRLLHELLWRARAILSVYNAGPSRHYPALHGEGKFFYLAVQALRQSWVSLQHIE